MSRPTGPTFSSAAVTRNLAPRACACAALLVSLVLLTGGAAIAQPYGGSCPRGQKFAAGACVTTCPAGYSDQGSYCRFRSMGD